MMKKTFSLLMLVTILAGTLWYQVGTASANALKVVVYMPGATQDDVENATVYVGSGYYNVNCVLKDAKTGKVVCSVNEKFASDGAVLYVAGLVYFVDLPSHANPGDPPDQEVPLTCEEGNAPGADVKFQYTLFPTRTATWFVNGGTLTEVANNASVYIGVKFSSFEVVSGLYCSSAR